MGKVIVAEAPVSYELGQAIWKVGIMSSFLFSGTHPMLKHAIKHFLQASIFHWDDIILKASFREHIVQTVQYIAQLKGFNMRGKVKILHSPEFTFKWIFYSIKKICFFFFLKQVTQAS